MGRMVEESEGGEKDQPLELALTEKKPHFLLA